MTEDKATANNESRPAVGAPVEPSVRRLAWRDAYVEAYRAANGGEAAIVESAAGWYRIRVGDEYTTGIQYRRKQIEAMTKRLLDRTSGRPAA